MFRVRRFEDSEGNIHDSMVWCLYADRYPDTPSSEIDIAAFDCRGVRLL